MIARRGFLGSMLAAAAAPAIITTPGILMPVRNIELFPLQVSGLFRVHDAFDKRTMEMVLHKAARRAGVTGSVSTVMLQPAPHDGDPLGQCGYVGWKGIAMLPLAFAPR